MKYFTLFLLLSLPAFAETFEKVRSVERYHDEAIITFWGTNQVYRLPKNSHLLPCLDNGLKAKKEVVLGMDKLEKIITKCKSN